MHKLSANNHEIINYDKVCNSSLPCKTIIGDILNYNHLKQIAQGIDLIIHLAAEHADNIYPNSLYYNVNVKGTQNIINISVLYKINKIIFTSTVAVYGLDANNAHEDSILKPFNDYGKSKLQAENILLDWSQKNSTRNLLIIRSTAVFGNNNRGNIYNLVDQIARKRFLKIGNCQNKKSIAYVENLIEFIFSSIKNKWFGIINYADKPDMKMDQLIDLIYEGLGYKRRIMVIPHFLGMIIGYLLDIISYLTKINFTIRSIRIKILY